MMLGRITFKTEALINAQNEKKILAEEGKRKQPAGGACHNPSVKCSRINNSIISKAYRGFVH